MRLPLVLVVFAAGCHPVRSVPDPDAPGPADDTGDPAPGETGDSGDTPDAGPTFRAVVVEADGILSSDAVGVNAAGQLAATVLVQDGESVRITVLRYAEGGEPIVATHDGDGFATAIDDDGTVALWVRGVGEAQGALFDGATTTLLGHIEGRGTRARAIRNGRVAGGCEDASHSEQICTWSEEGGWTAGGYGAAYGVSADGEIVGISAVDGWAYVAGDDLVPEPLWTGDPFGDAANAISANGRFVVGERYVRMGVDPDTGAAWWIDRQTGERREVPAVDEAPFREGRAEAVGVDDGGLTVGVATGSDGAPEAWIYDPWSGRAWDLADRLVAPLPDGLELVAARGVAGGFVAATAVATDGSTRAVLLVPVEGATPEPEAADLPAPPASTPTYTVSGLDADSSSWPIGFSPDGTPYARFAREVVPGAVELATGRVVDGEVELFPSGAAVPARVGDDGVLVGHGAVGGMIDAFRVGDDGEEQDLGRPDGSAAAFAYAADTDGAVVGECWTDGWRVCRRTDAGWADLGAGRAMDAAGEVVVGGDTTGAKLWDLSGSSEALFGRLATAVSSDGRWVAGTGEAAWVQDRASGSTWEMPAQGHVVPIDVGADGVVVGRAVGPRGEARAFRYAPGDESLGMLDLVTTGEGRLVSARAIGAGGRILAEAVDEAGLHHAVVLVPAE